MNEYTFSALQTYGLDDNEIAVYLACLELGPAKVQQIADKTKIKRTTIYLIAEKLKQRGLLSDFNKPSGVQYIASPPKQLLRNLKDQERGIEEALPELEALANVEASKPQVRFYEGKAGILEIVEDTLKIPNSEVLFMSSLSDIYQFVTAAYDEKYYIPTRVEKNIYFKALVRKDIRAHQLAKNNAKEMRELKFLPDNAVFTATQFIYQNKIAYISPKTEHIGIIIESTELANLEREKFNLLWNYSGTVRQIKQSVLC